MNNGENPASKLTKREYFAASIMSGLVSTSARDSFFVPELAGIAVEYTDEGKAERQRLTEEFRLSLREARKGDE